MYREVTNVVFDSGHISEGSVHSNAVPVDCACLLHRPKQNPTFLNFFFLSLDKTSIPFLLTFSGSFLFLTIKYLLLAPHRQLKVGFFPRFSVGFLVFFVVSFFHFFSLLDVYLKVQVVRF